VLYLDEEKRTDMRLCAIEVNKKTLGIYRLIGRNDEAITPAYEPGLLNALEQMNYSAFWRSKASFAAVRRRLETLALLDDGWDSCDAEAPNMIARELEERILDGLEAAMLPPTQLTPNVEGGITLCFVEGSNRAVIEIYNTAEVAAATYSDWGEPVVWDIDVTEDSMRDSIQKIRVHLAA
jgi:hypothetical protein